MFNRTITAIFLAGFFIILLVFFNPIVFGLILSIIAILAFNEWIGVMNVDPMKRKIILILQRLKKTVFFQKNFLQFMDQIIVVKQKY